MNITTILFDLDGTLLPMDQEAFTTGYFKFLAKKLAPYGYEPEIPRRRHLGGHGGHG